MFKAMLRDLTRDDCGATAIEYGLIVAMIALGSVVAMGRLGGASTGSLQSTVDSISNAMSR